MIETIKPRLIHLEITSPTGTSIRFASSLTAINSLTLIIFLSKVLNSSNLSSSASLSLLFFFLDEALFVVAVSSILSIVFFIAALTSFSSISNFLTRLRFLVTGVSSGVTSEVVFFLVFGRFFFLTASEEESVVSGLLSAGFCVVGSLLTCGLVFLSSPRSILPTTVRPRFLPSSLSFGDINFLGSLVFEVVFSPTSSTFSSTNLESG